VFSGQCGVVIGGMSRLYCHGRDGRVWVGIDGIGTYGHGGVGIALAKCAVAGKYVLGGL